MLSAVRRALCNIMGITHELVVVPIRALLGRGPTAEERELQKIDRLLAEVASWTPREDGE